MFVYSDWDQDIDQDLQSIRSDYEFILDASITDKVTRSLSMSTAMSGMGREF